jgi:hypothetical protein
MPATLLGGNGILLDFHPIRHIAGIQSIHTFEGTETIQTLIDGRDIAGVGVSWAPRQRRFARIRFRRNINAHPRGILVRPFGAGQDRHRRRGGTAYP